MKTNLLITLRSAAAALLLLSIPTTDAGVSGVFRADAPEEQAAGEQRRAFAFVGEADVKAVRGNAEVLGTDQEWQPLTSESRLEVGSVIRTGDDSSILLRMRNSALFIRVTPQTIVTLNALPPNWHTAEISGVDASTAFAVRALRGHAQFESSAGWQTLSFTSELAPGTRVRLSAWTIVDFFSSELGALRVQDLGEATLPTEHLTGKRIIRCSTPAIAFAK